MPTVNAKELVTFDVAPGEYRHWRLTIDGRVATLAMDVNEDAGLKPGYKLKLNSYDLGVDIELHNILQRIRFEHPEVACVVLTSARERMFCAGANIYMLGTSSHAWKVNFCKFTNETRNGMEDSSRHDGLKFLAALNGTVRWRRLRTRAGLRRDSADRRSLQRRQPAGSSAAGRAARYRRSDARGRQAQSASRSRRHVLHQS